MYSAASGVILDPACAFIPFNADAHEPRCNGVHNLRLFALLEPAYNIQRSYNTDRISRSISSSLTMARTVPPPPLSLTRHSPLFTLLPFPFFSSSYLFLFLPSSATLSLPISNNWSRHCQFGSDTPVTLLGHLPQCP